MALFSYKCPNCGGGLKFDPEAHTFRCEFCLSEFTEEEMKEIEAREAAKAAAAPGTEGEAGGTARQTAGAGAPPSGGRAAAAGEGRPGQMPPAGTGGQPETAGRSGGAVFSGSAGQPGAEAAAGSAAPGGGPAVYVCPSCGAEIVTDDTTAATICYYCHNPVVLSGRLSGEFLPDYVLPFAVDRKKAKEIFRGWIGKKKFVPRSFFSADQIDKLSGVYFPYLLYSCRVDGEVRAEAERLRSWTAGNIRYTEHKRYELVRGGVADVKNMARNALSKTNRELVEGVLPFDMDKLIPFSAGYLAGFQAEKRDMGRESFAAEVEQEVKNYTMGELTGSLDGFSSIQVRDSSMQIRDAKWSYALLPVWVLTYRERAGGKLYYFAINGQTGKTCGKLPVDKGRLAALFTGVFVPVFAFFLAVGWFL